MLHELRNSHKYKYNIYRDIKFTCDKNDKISYIENNASVLALIMKYQSHQVQQSFEKNR